MEGNKPSAGGYFSGNRTSATQIDFYFGNSFSTHSNIASGSGAQTGAAITDQVLWAFALNGIGTISNWTASRISFMALHQGFSATDSFNFFNAIQTLRTDLGGGYV